MVFQSQEAIGSCNVFPVSGDSRMFQCFSSLRRQLEVSMFFQSKEVTECILSLYIPEKFQCFSGLWRQQEVFKIFQSQETARSFNNFPVSGGS